MGMKISIMNGMILLPEGLRQGTIEIENGIIKDITQNSYNEKSTITIDAKDNYILPGFIDIHTNGIAGFDLTNGVFNLESGRFILEEENYIKGLDNALNEYARTGVTSAVLTSIASPLDQLKQVFRFVYNYKQNHINSPWKEVLNGIFIEGTFIKLKDYSGAQNPDFFNEPSIQLFETLQESAGGLIKIVNIVPEWGEPAINLIKYLASRNIICAAGHTGALGCQYDKAIKNGLKLAVHFLNGPTGSSYKSFDGGGAVENVLRASDMFVEIIVDGYHVDKSYVMDIIKRKGFNNVVAITDSMFAAAFKGLNEFNMLGINGSISENKEYIHIKDREYVLFGSMLTMDIAFSNVLTWLTSPVKGIWHELHQPLEFEDALIKASSICSKNPAKVLGIFSPIENKHNREKISYTGSIERGKNADLIIANIEKNDSGYKLEINNVFVKGNKI